MRREELLAQLAQDHPEASEDRSLSLSSQVIRVPSRRLVAVGSDAQESTQINGLLDAIHWARWSLGSAEGVTYSIMSGECSDTVLEPLSTLFSLLPSSLGVQLQQDFLPFEQVSPQLDADSPRRLEQLRRLEQADLPVLHNEIQRNVADSSFQWVRTLTGRDWTGRVDGLRVCRLDDRGVGVIEIGRSPADEGLRPEQEWFRSIAGGDSFKITSDNIPQTVRVLQSLVEGRRRGLWAQRQLEHLLEARVLRGAVPISIENEVIQPVKWGWQFPARWAEMGAVRYIDVLGRIGTVPWVVELKVREGGGAGQYFRHAVGQAVLYREFIRRAAGLHPWFQEQGLDPHKCEAVVVMPCSEVAEGDRQLLEHVRYLADLFSVRVVVLDDAWRSASI